MARRPDDRPPSLAMVVAGGVGVVAVVGFVAAVAFGARPVPPSPGDRLAVSRTGRSVEVLVARCPVERVRQVQVRDDDGTVRWRITSAKGSIDTRYVVGGEAPTGFVTDVELGPGALSEGALAAEVAIDRDGGTITDRMAFTVGDAPADGVRHRGRAVDEDAFRGRAIAAAACPGSDPADRGTASWIFAAGAVAVVVTYAGMVARWWRGRGRG